MSFARYGMGNSRQEREERSRKLLAQKEQADQYLKMLDEMVSVARGPAFMLGCKFA